MDGEENSGADHFFAPGTAADGDAGGLCHRIAGAVFFLQQQTLSFSVPVQLVLTQTQSFVMLAIPLFIFAGNLLNETGITNRLLKLASVLAGHLRAGMAQSSVILSTLMGGITGSAIADASMQARILGKGMTDRGYARAFPPESSGFPP
jgi:TRAP-type uncharacterized transport system fused permease subunit